LYHHILYSAFPIFKLKTKNLGGLHLIPSRFEVIVRKIRFRLRQYANIHLPYSRYGISPWNNFMDFSYQIRRNKQYNNLIIECLENLKKRNLIENFNIDKIYADHMKGKENTKALLLLTSLEYHLLNGLDQNKLSY